MLIPATPALLLFFATLLAAPLLMPAAAQTPDWQQRVHYEMDVSLIPERHAVHGSQRLTYYNNSPDTLRRVFYHLYFNAFHPRSMMAERNRHLPDPDRRVVPRIFELTDEQVGFHIIEELRQNGRSVAFEIFDTVMDVTLAEPILPGDSTVFEMRFRSQVPLQTRRSGRDSREGIDYSMTQWYPKMAAYDHLGWHAVPYVGREFFAPFGRFDVRITLPARYIIGATGVLQNPGEIGHGYADFPVDHTGRDSLTWHFVADDVHDFAWAADPDYVHERFPGPFGTTLHLLYLPEVADRWALLSDQLPRMINFMSERFGRYPYPQFTVVQGGDGGMEYPMITLITGRRPPRSVAGVTAHELAHMWYYGVLGTNESRHSWIDEGFTSYASAEIMNYLFGTGPRANHAPSHLNFISMHHQGVAEPINLPADWFATNRAFGITAYSGGAMFLDMLGYVISDELRDRFLLALFDEYKFRHPHPEDIRRVAERVSGIELDWYFDQWLHTTRRLDYRVSGLSSRRGTEGWRTRVNLRRAGEIFMPVDVLLALDDGTYQMVTVPTSLMYGHKPVYGQWQVAQPWPWTSPDYTLEITTPARVVRAVIDPFGRTPDWNRLGNTSDRLPSRVRFLHPPPTDYFRYGIGWRPLADYAHHSGVGVGVQFRGTYILTRHQTQFTLKARPELIGTGASPDALFDVQFNYETPFHSLRPMSRFRFSASKMLGIAENRIGIAYPLGRYPALQAGTNRLDVDLTHQARTLQAAFAGAPRISTGAWPRPSLLFASMAYERSRDEDFIRLKGDLGGAMSAGRGISANRLLMHGRKSFGSPRLGVAATLTAGGGTANLAPQRRFRLGTVPLESQFRNAAVRTIGGAFEDPMHEWHFGALAPVGPVAYLLADTQPPAHANAAGMLDPAGFASTRGGVAMLAGHFSAEARPLAAHPWLGGFSAELFSGAGIVSRRLRDFTFDGLIADAGAAVNLDVSRMVPLARWIRQSDVLQQLHLTARFPFFASHPELIGPDESRFGMRWLVGVRTEM